mgnify:CR=1 FL=1
MAEILLSYSRRPTVYNEMNAKAIHKMHLKNELSSTQKMELYDCGVKGDLEKLKTLISNKQYNLLEECSASGYFWTVLHYASHYGFVNIVRHVVEAFKNDPKKIEKLKVVFSLANNPIRN